MAKRPVDSPFAALASLRGQVRPLSPQTEQGKPKSAAPTPPTEPRDSDDGALFRQAMAGTQMLRPPAKAEIQRPKPQPIPRPKPPAAADDAPYRAPPAPPDPRDAAALFRYSVGEVVPLKDDGRAEVGRATPRHRRLAPRDDPAATDRSPLPLPPLPDHADPAALFRHAVGSVAPLADTNRVAPSKPLPPPRPIKREEDEASVLREALEAPLSFQDRLDTGDESAFLREGIPRRVLTDLRRGRWVIQRELDMHGNNREEARAELGHFLAEALEQGLRCVRIIHGKGHGSPGRISILKQLSRGWLMQRDEILAFCQARPHDGGEGALMVLLRSKRRATKSSGQAADAT